MAAKVSRRDVMRAAAGMAAGAVLAAADADAQTVDAPPSPEKPAADALTIADLASADKIAGRVTTDAERTQMLRSVPDVRKAALAVRTSALAAEMSPAFAFDPRLAGETYPRGKDSLRLAKGSPPKFDAGDLDALAFAPVSMLSGLIKSKKITSVALTEMYLARLRKYAPRLLCVVSMTEETARAEAANADKLLASGTYLGPLHGIPYGVKDLLAAKGTRTTFGAPPFKENLWDYDSTVVARLRAAGVVLCAKFSMGELAMGDVWFGGTTRSPWDVTRGSSGSSAGSASATAAGLVGFSIGTETLGSITSPSQVCGTTGLRPTFGRVSRYGAMPLSWTMDKIGPITRGVEDCALVLAAIHGADGRDGTAVDGIPFRFDAGSKLSDLRVGVDESAVSELRKSKNAEKIKAWDDAMAVLKTLGVTMKPVSLPKSNEAYDALADLIISVEGAASFANLTASGGLRDLVQQADWNWPNAFRTANHVAASDYIQAMRVRAHLQRAMAEATRDVDVYVTVPFAGNSLLYTNLCGQPTVITRSGATADGKPVSIEFTGALYREDAALRLALAFEAATDWHTRWPDVDALPATPPAVKRGGGE